MSLRLQITAPGAAPREVPLLPGRNTIVAAPGEQYRLLGDPGEIPPDLRVLRVGNAMVVTGLPAAQALELGNFFGACRPGSDCSLSIAVTGSTELVVGNETAPLAALPDGSFVLVGAADGSSASAVAAAGGGSGDGGPGFGKGALALLGALGIAAAAAGGGGGGGGGGSAPAASGSTAVLGATESMPTPMPAQAPAAAAAAAPAPAPAPAPALAPAPSPAPAPAPAADTTRPTLAITDDSAATTHRPVTVTFAFSEPVTGFTAADVAVSGGTLGPLVASPDARTWTMTVTPQAGIQAGTLTVDVGAGAAADAAGNPSVAAVRDTQAYDTRGPLPVITDATPASTTNQPVTFRFAFDEPVVGFTAADAVVGGGTAGAFVLAADGRSASLVATPQPGVDAGTLSAEVFAGAMTDALGNPSAAARATQAFDTAPPRQRVAAFTALDDQAPQTGLLPNGATTNDRTPTLSLTLDAFLGPGETLVIARDGAPIRSTTSGGTTTLTDATLASGPHAYSANIADGAGNSTVLDLNGLAAGTAFLLTVG